MSLSPRTQHAIRRSTRLPLEIPVLLTSLDDGTSFSRQCNTTLVNAHGCGVIAPQALENGLRVQLEIVPAKRQTTARVAAVVGLGGEPETWLVGLELYQPGNFWGIEYAPSDWKVEDHPTPGNVTAAENAQARQFRLTDISSGACYLETSTPIPAGTPVLLSIRLAETEYLLDGVARVFHEQAGTGIEFLQEPGGAIASRVEALIAALSSAHEIPKIFVGRKEHQKISRNAAADHAGDPAFAACQPDPLLHLIRKGASLSPAQFLQELRSQRRNDRETASV